MPSSKMTGDRMLFQAPARLTRALACSMLGGRHIRCGLDKRGRTIVPTWKMLYTRQSLPDALSESTCWIEEGLFCWDTYVPGKMWAITKEADLKYGEINVLHRMGRGQTARFRREAGLGGEKHSRKISRRESGQRAGQSRGKGIPEYPVPFGAPNNGVPPVPEPGLPLRNGSTCSDHSKDQSQLAHM